MKLYRELDQFEHSLLLLNTPKLVISEGIAEIAVNMLFSYQEQAEIGLRNFCPDPSKEHSIDKLAMQNKVKGEISKIIESFDIKINFHDFRMVSGEKRENLVFDIEIPFGTKKSKVDEIKQSIYIKAKDINPNYYCKITIDYMYVKED